jgi:hypothetical protein
MSKWPMRGHFQYLRFKTFPTTPRTLQCEVFWALLSNSKHSGVPEDSKSPTLEVLGFTPTLGQSGVATMDMIIVIVYNFSPTHIILNKCWISKKKILEIIFPKVNLVLEFWISNVFMVFIIILVTEIFRF